MVAVSEDPVAWFIELGIGLSVMTILQLAAGVSTALLLRLPQSIWPLHLILAFISIGLLGTVSRRVFDPTTHISGALVGAVSFCFSIPLYSLSWIFKERFVRPSKSVKEVIIRTAFPLANVRQNSSTESPVFQFCLGALHIALATVLGPHAVDLYPTQSLFSLLVLVLFVTCGASGILNLSSATTCSVFKLKSSSPFNYPLLSISLKEFWGLRWNATVSDALREGVYRPLTEYYKVQKAAAVLCTFFVSGVAHEVIFLYCNFSGSRGEWLAFFVMHGILVILEKLWYPYIFSQHVLTKFIVTAIFLLSTAHFFFFPVTFRLGFMQRAAETFTALPTLIRHLGLKWSHL